jgi:hypothetical protein
MTAPHCNARCLALAAFAAAVIGLLFVDVAQAATSHVRGHVTSHLTGAPLPSRTISILDGAGNDIPNAYTATDQQGEYSWSGDCPDSAGATCSVKLGVDYEFDYQTLQASFANGAADAVVDFVPHALGSIRASVNGPNGAEVSALGWELGFLPGIGADDAHGALVLFRFDDTSGAWQRVEAPEIQPFYQPPTLYLFKLLDGRYRLCFGGLDTGTQRQCFDHRAEAARWSEQTYTDIDLAEGEHRTDLTFDLIGGGTLGGTITDAHKNQPLAQDDAGAIVRVELFDADGALFDRGLTWLHADSSYHASGTPKGKFRVASGLTDEAYREDLVLWPNLPCVDGVCPLAQGTLVATSDSSETDGIDLDVHPSVVIAGRVTDAKTNLPLAGARVDDWWPLYSPFAGVPPPPAAVRHQTITDGDGRYEVYAQAGISVFPEASLPGYFSTCAGASSCPSWLPDTTALGDTIALDIQLQPGGTVSGSVRDAATGAGVSAGVRIYDTSGNSVADFSVKGDFRSPALADGTYYVQAYLYVDGEFQPGTGPDNNRGDCQLFAARPCPRYPDALSSVAPTPVVVTQGSDVGGFDFVLVADRVFIGGFE